MAIFHMNIRIVSRSGKNGSGGKSGTTSAISVAAYNAGDKLKDFETGKTISKTGKTEVVYSEIDLCKGAPEEYKDRETLWNAVQKREVRSDAQLARNLEFSIPKEVTDRDHQIEMIRRYVQEQFVSKGMIADWSIHDKGDGNPHCHCLLTMRGIDEKTGDWADYKMRSAYKLDADGKKIPRIDPVTGQQMVRDRTAQGKGIEKLWERVNIPANPWNNPKNVEKWREAWADVCNFELKKLNVDPIDHRSFERQGIDRLPMIHEGWEARHMESRGELSDRCQENRIIKTQNHFLNLIGDRIENRSLVNSILEKVRAIGTSITSVPHMILAISRDVPSEIVNTDRIEKGGVIHDRSENVSNDRGGRTGTFRDFIRSLGFDRGESGIERKGGGAGKLDQGESYRLDGRHDFVGREEGRDYIDAEDYRSEGRIDRGI